MLSIPRRSWRILFCFCLVFSLSPSLVSSKAILGVDMGSEYMKVALVQRGAPLEIVTNLHSKRKTETMILFDSNARFYGADASSLIARKPLQTPMLMTVMLGRDSDHPCVKTLTERYFPITPQYNETRSGTNVAVDNQVFTPEELVAMVLSHAKDMTQTYVGELGKDAQAAPSDCVLTVPAFATVHERRALLDAAALADLNVLGLLEENTAAALHYAMDKQFPEPQIIVFYNMGGASVQVSVVKFHNYNVTSGLSTKPKTVGALEVLSKAWDATVGGQSFDHRIVEYLADTFNQHWDKQRNDGKKKDVRTVPRAMTKLRLQANKVKHVLSANQEIPIYMDALHDDYALITHMTRDMLEELCADIIDRATKPIFAALGYANISLDDIDGLELIGGGMRVPRIQTDLKKALNDIELGMHINGDESMALGAAFYGANLSTAFRVRHVGLVDVNPFPIRVSLQELVQEEPKKGLFGGGGKKKMEPGDDDEPWGKNATILKAFGKLGVKKTIAFTYDKDIHCALDYEGEAETLPQGTPLALDRFNITGVEAFAKEMEEKKLGKPKVSLQFQLTESGLTKLVKAEATVEELYTVEEEIEVDDDDAEDPNNATNVTSEGEAIAINNTASEPEAVETDSEMNATGSNTTSSDANASSVKSEVAPKKKKKTIKEEKEKKRIHKRSLSVKAYTIGKVQPYSPALMEESRAKLAELARKDKERILLEAAKNKLESYTYHIKNKLVDDEENIKKVSTEEQRSHVMKLAEGAEEWMYEDGVTADLAATEAKYAEIFEPAEKIFERVIEMTARPEAIEALKGRLAKVGELMDNWKTTMPQVTDEERGEVLNLVEGVKAWLAEKEQAQAHLEPHEDPVFTSAEVPAQMKPIERLVARLKKKPKPAKKNETEKANDTNTADINADESNSTEEEADSSESADETKGTDDSERLSADNKTDDEL